MTVTSMAQTEQRTMHLKIRGCGLGGSVPRLWIHPGTRPRVLDLGSISLDGDVGGVLAMTLPRPIAVPRRRLVRPVSSVSVSSLSGWQALSRAPELDYLGRFIVAQD